MTESEWIERIVAAEQNAAAAKALAEDAAESCRAALVKQTENEARLKSIQHRMDNTEGKMDTVLDNLAQINKAITESNGIQAGTRKTVKIFASIVSVLLSVMGGIFTILRFFRGF